jgi:cyclopropane-fatty-acyl-phospholipid synthase
LEEIMTQQVQYSASAGIPASIPRAERLFFELVGPAIANEPLHFLVDGREYRYGSGSEPIVIRITNPDFFASVLSLGNLGLGEAYMHKKFDIVRGSLEDFLTSLARSSIEKSIRAKPLNMLRLSGVYLRNFFRGRYRNVQSHYDSGVDFFEAILDQSMAYSCGYAQTPDDTLAELQTHKFDRICRKLRLQPGERLLDIGCGFGGLLIYAAKHYGVCGIGITISRDQHHRARANAAAEGVADKVDIRFSSHQTLPGKFDKVVSVGMFEHLTRRDYPAYFGNIKRALVDGGLGLVHSIGCTSASNWHDPFFQKYIFPGSRCPQLSEISHHLEKQDLPILDVENIARCYGPTLRRWNENLQKNYPKLDHRKYDESHKRMFEYYFACGIAAARFSECAVFQVLFANTFRVDVPFSRI